MDIARKYVLKKTNHLLSDYRERTIEEKKVIDKELLSLGDSLLETTRRSREERGVVPSKW